MEIHFGGRRVLSLLRNGMEGSRCPPTIHVHILLWSSWVLSKLNLRIVSHLSLQLEVLSVISSGETDGFETYAFDTFTNHVAISGQFRSMVESISILEVSVVCACKEKLSCQLADFPYPTKLCLRGINLFDGPDDTFLLVLHS